MKSSPSQFCALSAALFGFILPSLHAQTTATTDPVGFVTVNLPGSTDCRTYIPFKRTPEYAGSIQSASGTNGSLLTAAGTPNFGNLVYSSPAQPKKYYILFTSGTKSGLYYSITANTTTSLTVDTAGDDLSGVASSTFQVIPYDTLNTIFPAGQGINASSGFGGSQRKTEILIPDNTTAGTDLAAAKTYYYYSGVVGTGPGWRMLNSTGDTTTIVNDDILLPDSPLIVRQKVATGTSVTYMGTVHMGQTGTYIGTINTGTAQDNAVALPVASDLTLAQTKLYESGGFMGSTGASGSKRRDQLLVWDNAVPGTDKAADRTYYYLTVTGPLGNPPGWRLLGDNTDTVCDNVTVVTSSTGLVIRKYSTGAPSSVLWTFKPPYVP